MAKVTEYTYQGWMEALTPPPLSHPPYGTNGTVKLKPTPRKRATRTQKSTRAIFARAAETWRRQKPPTTYHELIKTFNTKSPFTVQKSLVGSAALIS